MHHIASVAHIAGKLGAARAVAALYAADDPVVPRDAPTPSAAIFCNR
jgi:hypothetical protein